MQRSGVVEAEAESQKPAAVDAPSARRRLLLASCAWFVATAADAQPQTRLRQVGILANVRAATGAGSPLQQFIEALRDLGWTEGRTVSFEYRFAEQRYERFPDLARELVAAEPDLIVVAAGVTAAL